LRPYSQARLAGLSCLANLLEYLQNATNILDSGDPVDVVYFDFQKAFDKGPHERLLSKLRAHGVGGSVYAWIRKWQINRKQKVVIKFKLDQCIEWCPAGISSKADSVHHIYQ